MGTTFVGIGDCGFWMRDSVLEIWLRFLALHVEDTVDSGSLASTIRDQWLIASRGHFNGCVPEGLEEAVSTAEGDAIVRKAIHSLMNALKVVPDHLDAGVLNLMGFSGAFEGKLETRRLIEVGRAYLDLLDGQIKAGPSDSSFMPGCG